MPFFRAARTIASKEWRSHCRGNPGIRATLEKLTVGGESPEKSRIDVLRKLVALDVIDEQAIASTVKALRSAARALAGTDAERSRQRANLLEQALSFDESDRTKDSAHFPSLRSPSDREELDLWCDTIREMVEATERRGGSRETRYRQRMKLGIKTSVRRCVPDATRRVRYCHGGERLIPEQIVLRRWKERSREPAAQAQGIRYDGCRLPPGTFALVKRWVEDGLTADDLTDPSVLRQRIEAARAGNLKLRAPEPTKLAAVLSYLINQGVLHAILERERSTDAPGIPDLFLWRVSRDGVIHRTAFVEVKRWNRTARMKEPVSRAQRAELAFLRSLGLHARVVYLLE